VRVLVLHPNFPGQFRHLASGLAAAGHTVLFLCQTHYGRELAGVQRLCMKGGLGHDSLLQGGADQLSQIRRRGQQYRRALEQMEQQGLQPDVVISHSGWGCGLYVKECWPRCRLVSYLEWWFDPLSPLLTYDPHNRELELGPQRGEGLWQRNEPLALELAAADAIVAPTAWQRAQLPPLLRQHCQVIFDGIDLQVFRPDPGQRSPTPLLTYGTRGMEPMRGFPQLIRELPAVLERWPQLRVEIAGEDAIHYGGSPPAEGSWKGWAEQLLAAPIAAGRLRWLGRLEGKHYVRWLQSSWVHVYLSHPFVASWSLVEALACGPRLIASRVPPVAEFCREPNQLLVDHRQPGFLLQALPQILPHHPSGQALPIGGPNPSVQLAELDRQWCLRQWGAVLDQLVHTNPCAPAGQGGKLSAVG
jgi:glycosyltransferase involved in cell wall biosynthesis